MVGIALSPVGFFAATAWPPLALVVSLTGSAAGASPP